MERVGIGTDLHRLAFGRSLVLGGVRVDSPKGAVGHSDGDTLTHAVIDAILGASGLGDIGHHFPDSDQKWKDANSIEMLKTALQLVKHAGYEVVNIDASVHLEQPKLGGLKGEMASNLAAALNIPRHMVNIKAKSGESVGDVGRGEVVEAFVAALVRTVV
jgi:2-C-methyl-D-erythritol 2,4-cyclodiphosphate synthase